MTTFTPLRGGKGQPTTPSSAHQQGSDKGIEFINHPCRILGNLVRFLIGCNLANQYGTPCVRVHFKILTRVNLVVILTFGALSVVLWSLCLSEGRSNR